MRADVRQAESLDVLQRRVRAQRERVGEGAGFVACGAGQRLPRDADAIEIRDLPMSVPRRGHDGILQVFANVEIAEPAFSHQPFVRGRRSEIDAHRFHVDGHRAGSLHHVGEHIGAVRVRELADRARVVQVAVHVGHERHRNETGVPVDGALHVLDVDRPVAVLDHAQLEALCFERLVHVERRLEVQLVKDDVAASLGQVHTHDDDVLAVRRVLNERDFVGLGANQRREPAFQVLLLLFTEIDAPFAGAIQPELNMVAERP